MVYDKPALSSSNRIIFYAGIPATKILSASGFPTSAIGPFDDGVGYSAGATFSALLPPFLTLTSGIGGAANGTAHLAFSVPASSIGMYTLSLTIQETAAPAPGVTNPATQLSTTVPLNVYVVPFGDVNLDFIVNCADLAAIKNAFGKVRGTPGYNDALDINGDGIINVRDLALVASQLPAGTTCQ